MNKEKAVKPLYRNINWTKIGNVVRKYHWWLAGGLLAVMFALSFGSMVNDSAIVDEIAHIPAGYSYLHYGDYRLNPEHPPLLKDLAGLPLQFLNLKFPVTMDAWTKDVNGQWDLGWNFLYHIGNDANLILFWARLPILLTTIAFGGFLYWIVRRRWGTAAGLITLAFYALSPNLLAHDHYVTTDMGAAAFTFVALIAFVWFVERPTWRRVLVLSLALAVAQLAKFNGVLLYPFLGAITLGVAFWWPRTMALWPKLRRYAGRFLAASGLSVLWIWIFYAPHVMNMPDATQDALINGSLVDQRYAWLTHLLTSWDNIAILKPIVQYILGVAMVFGRVSGGNTTYFNGQVTNQSFHWYFPELFLAKTQIALLVLMAVIVGVLAWRLWRDRSAGHWRARFENSFQARLAEWIIGGFAAFYFVVSVAGNLNLGIRHILPIYVPIFVLAAVGGVRLLRDWGAGRWYRVAQATMALLIVLYGASTLLAYPSYTPYLNEAFGGAANADKYFSDSSVDWGQDLIRFKQYVDVHPEIAHIALDYFGGGDVSYYFCARAVDAQGHKIYTAAGYDCAHSKVTDWHAQYGRYTGQYIAVSETFLENDRWYAALDHRSGYDYLRAMTPIAKIGGSIYVYKMY